MFSSFVPKVDAGPETKKRAGESLESGSAGQKKVKVEDSDDSADEEDEYLRENLRVVGKYC